MIAIRDEQAFTKFRHDSHVFAGRYYALSIVIAQQYHENEAMYNAVQRRTGIKLAVTK